MKNKHHVPASDEATAFNLIDYILNSIPSIEVNSTLASGVLFGIVVMIGIWILWLDFDGFGNSHAMPPGEFKSKAILTNNEIEFYNRMVSALPGYVVLAQVAMGAVIEPRTSDPKEYMRKRIHFSQKIIDFIVCEPGDLKIIAIVELDDVTHDPVKDAKRDKMLSGAGYNLIRWHSRNKPDRAAIAKAIRKLDSRNGA